MKVCAIGLACGCGSRLFVPQSPCAGDVFINVTVDCINCGRPHAVSKAVPTGDTYCGEPTSLIWKRTQDIERSMEEDE